MKCATMDLAVYLFHGILLNPAVYILTKYTKTSTCIMIIQQLNLIAWTLCHLLYLSVVDVKIPMVSKQILTGSAQVIAREGAIQN